MGPTLDSLVDIKSDNSNQYTVTELSNLIKRTIEDNFTNLRVKGEISGLKIAPSGHSYFSLKDNQSVIAAICWKYNANKLSTKLTEGLEIIAIGSLTTYNIQSKYQFIVERIEVAGEGVLLALLAKRRELFSKEGLFDLARKKTIPKYPQLIGIITSITGAVIKDIIHRLKDRMPLDVIIWPTLVQGEQAAKQISEAIIGFNNLINIDKPDVIIIARGGGSIEDLWAFNEEILVRSVANSEIPIISAIGHETDTSLVDYASDLRAPTPTAAAELVVAVRAELLANIDQYKQYIKYNIENYFKQISFSSSIITKEFNKLAKDITASSTQQLDELSFVINNLVIEIINQYYNKLQVISARLRNPNLVINNFKTQLYFISDQLINYNKQLLLVKSYQLKNINFNYYQDKLVNNINNKQEKLAYLASQLASISSSLVNNLSHKLIYLLAQLTKYDHQQILKQGFVMIKNDQQFITKSSELFSKKKYKVIFADGIKEIVVK